MYCPLHAAIVRADARVACLTSASSKISAFGAQNRWIIFLRRFGRPQLVGKAIGAFLQQRGVQHLSLICWEDEKVQEYIDHYLGSTEHFIWGPKAPEHIVSFALQACRQAILQQTTATFFDDNARKIDMLQERNTSQSPDNCCILCRTGRLVLWTNMACMPGLCVGIT